MKLDYGTIISPVPIKLSIGTIKNPTLREISELTFDEFNYYQFLLKLTPKLYFTKLLKKFGGEEQWESLSPEEKVDMTLYDLIVNSEQLQKSYENVFNFFFLENVIYVDGLFILVDNHIKDLKTISKEQIKGVINDKIFPETLLILQQICGIYSKEDSIENHKFKNDFQKQMYMQMLELKAKQKEEKSENPANINLSIPNIISSVSSRHPSLNYINIWEITIYQLLDTFGKMQSNEMYNINSTRVSVWGDEKNTFDTALWYKNQYD